MATMSAARRQLLDGMIFPETHRTFVEVLIDETDHMWIRRFDPRSVGSEKDREMAAAAPTLWDVFDPDGRFGASHAAILEDGTRVVALMVSLAGDRTLEWIERPTRHGG